MKLIRDHDNVTKWDRRQERMKYLEKVLGDSAEEHAKLLAKQKKDLTWEDSWDALHGCF